MSELIAAVLCARCVETFLASDVQWLCDDAFCAPCYDKELEDIDDDLAKEQTCPAN